MIHYRPPTPSAVAVLTLTFRLTAYDNGMLELDTVPLNDHHNDDDVTGWLAAAEVITATLSEFHRQVTARADAQTDG